MILHLRNVRLILNRIGMGGQQYGEMPKLTQRPDGAVMMTVM